MRNTVFGALPEGTDHDAVIAECECGESGAHSATISVVRDEVADKTMGIVDHFE